MKPIRLWIILSLIWLLMGCAPASTSLPSPIPVPTLIKGAPAGRLLGLQFRSDYADFTAFDLAQATGAHWARYPIRWRQLEPKRTTPPTYQWSYYDKAVHELSRRGFEIVLTIRDNPKWASDTLCGPLNEEGKQALGQMVTELVHRYAVEPYRVKHWELYNEPDNADPVGFGELGGCWGNAPAAYAEMLKIAYEAIKGADPEAIVIFGGLALEKFEDSPFDVEFLPKVLKAGGGPYFDWINFHYYPAFSYRWDKYGRGVEGKAAYVRKLLRDAGLEKPVACSEIGQPSAGPAAEGYSDERTMAQVFKGFAQALSADLQFAIWYILDDQPNDVRMYGLLGPGLQPKPAYRTYQILAQALASAYFERVLSAEETGDKRIEAYRFAVSGGEYRTLLIAWRVDEGPALALPIPAGQVLLTDVAGQETLITEGGEGDLNPAAGALSIGISSAPLLIRY